MRREFSG
jgi:Dullard-like phosphatase family protein